MNLNTTKEELSGLWDLNSKIAEALEKKYNSSKEKSTFKSPSEKLLSEFLKLNLDEFFMLDSDINTKRKTEIVKEPDEYDDLMSKMFKHRM